MIMKGNERKYSKKCAKKQVCQFKWDYMINENK